jgi:hypothetical protein
MDHIVYRATPRKSRSYRWLIAFDFARSASIQNSAAFVLHRDAGELVGLGLLDAMPI